MNKLSEDANRAVEFGSRIVKLTTSSDEAGHSAWQALGARVSSLVNAELCDTPPLHSNLDFQAVIDEARMCKSNGMLAGVVTCDASAAHSSVEGDKERRCDHNESVTFVVNTCDLKGRVLRRGGDWIVVRCGKRPEDARTDLKSRIWTTAMEAITQLSGNYVFEVFVNGAKMANILSITCDEKVTFYRGHCRWGPTLSNSEQTTSHRGDDDWNAVAGKPAMETGKHH